MRLFGGVRFHSLSLLRQRGFVASETHPEETERVLSMPTKVYAGYDPTADGLHVGSLVTLLALAHLQRLGHTPVVLIGGATGLIGDPSGRETERSLLQEETARENARMVERDAVALLQRVTNPNGPAPIVVNNLDWWRDISSMALLRDIGRHFRVPTMLRRESVSRRMESHDGISFTEFSYQLLQSHDFFHLHRHFGVCLQLGGSDQWGNITAGIDYARRRSTDNPGSDVRMAGVCVPLISTKDGNKLGKSAGNAVWLSPAKTSHLDMYQYFVNNATDQMVSQWLKLLTFLPIEEIDRVCALGGGAAQKELAFRVVELVRGTEAANEAKRASLALFGGEGNDAPKIALKRDRVQAAFLVDLMVEELGLAPSKAEARRLIEQGGVFVNDRRVESVQTKGSILDGEGVILRAGKKKRVAVKVEQ